VSHPLTSVDEVTARAFDPWQAVDDHADLRVVFDPVARLMGGGFHARAGERAVIVLDPDLDDPLRRVVLTHELVHHERGGGPQGPDAPATLRDLVQRDEHAVDAEVARRLVPGDQLASVVHELVAGAGSVSIADVAAHFGVPDATARLALAELGAGRRPRAHPGTVA
jgi:IrrE N-terminal-like domain